MSKAAAHSCERVSYPAYKPSGVRWLGDIPEHWEVKPLKRTFAILNGSTPKSSEPDFWDGDIAWATPDDLGSLAADTMNATKRAITLEGYRSCGTTIAPTGSLVLSTRAPIGHLAIAGVPLCTNQGCRCLVFRKKAQSRFYYYQLLNGRHELESWGQGSTFMELGRDRLAMVYLVSPPIDEQRAISAFLDQETARIDTLIEKKQQQIKLLQEKRSALISHAVTKGLSAINTRTNTEKWKEARLGRLIKLQRGIDITGASEQTEGFPVFSSGGLSGYSGAAMVKGPGVIVGRKGTLGTVHYSSGDYWPHDTTLWVKEFRGNLPRFVYYYLIHMRLERYDVGAANPTLNRNHVHPVPVSFPDVETQEKIVSFLDEMLQRDRTLLERVVVSITKLNEYRTALISAAVTGKIDVRESIV